MVDDDKPLWSMNEWRRSTRSCYRWGVVHGVMFAWVGYALYLLWVGGSR